MLSKRANLLKETPFFFGIYWIGFWLCYGGVPIVSLVLFTVIEIVASFLYNAGLHKVSSEDEYRELAQRNQWIAINHAVLDLLITVRVILLLAVGGLSYLHIIALLIPYVTARLFTQSSITFTCHKIMQNALDRRRITIEYGNLQILLHLVPFVNAICAVLVHRKLNKQASTT